MGSILSSSSSSEDSCPFIFVNYDDILSLIHGQQMKNGKRIYLINTLKESEQDCLLPHTLPMKEETSLMNTILNENKTHEIIIFIYGKNCHDISIYKKFHQLKYLGFPFVYLYGGGLFEWLCLQEIYGFDMFQTTKKELDIIRYTPQSNFHNLLQLSSSPSHP